METVKKKRFTVVIEADETMQIGELNVAIDEGFESTNFEYEVVSITKEDLIKPSYTVKE